MTFDIVLGNPPYQKGSTTNSRKGCRTHIWHEFVALSIIILKDSGYLLFITPYGWRIPGRFAPTFQLIKENNLLYLNITEKPKDFNISIGYDWYLLQKKRYERQTIINDADDTNNIIDITNHDIIPNRHIEQIHQLTKGKEKVKFLFSRTLYGHDKPTTRKNKCNDFKYPVVYTISKKSGIKYYWTNDTTLGHFGIPKIIWSNGSNTDIIYDKEGKYGMTEFAYALIVEDDREAEKLIKLLNSEIILNAFKNIAGTKYHPKLIKLLAKSSL